MKRAKRRNPESVRRWWESGPSYVCFVHSEIGPDLRARIWDRPLTALEVSQLSVNPFAAVPGEIYPEREVDEFTVEITGTQVYDLVGTLGSIDPLAKISIREAAELEMVDNATFALPPSWRCE